MKSSILSLLFFIALILYTHLTALTDLYTGTQPLTAGYILDIITNQNWLLPNDLEGNLPTKPPLYPWLGAIFVTLFGSTAEWVLKFPSVVAFGFSCLFIYLLARDSLDKKSSLCAVAIWIANPRVFRVMYFVRPDMLVTLFVIIGLFAIQKLRTDEKKRYHYVCWIAFACAALTKGPPALLIPLWLLLTCALDRAWDRLPSHLLPFSLSLVAIASWFFPALYTCPNLLSIWKSETYDRVLGIETMIGETGSRLDPLWYCFTQYAPWSILCVCSIPNHREWKPDLKWTLWWTLLIIAFFSLSKGQRAFYMLSIHASISILTAAILTLPEMRLRYTSLFYYTLSAFALLAGIYVFAIHGVLSITCLLIALALFLFICHSYNQQTLVAAFLISCLLVQHKILDFKRGQLSGGEELISFVKKAKDIALLKEVTITCKNLEKTHLPILLHEKNRSPNSKTLLITTKPYWDQHCQHGEMLSVTSPLNKMSDEIVMGLLSD